MGGMLACAQDMRNAALCKAARASLYKRRPAPSGFLALEQAVTGSRISSEKLDARRRRLLFRCWHRGIREMDLVLGRFADAEIAGWNDAELDDFEQLLEIPDQPFFAWVSGAEAVPAEYDTPMFRRLRAFHDDGKGVR
jgi:antitoxin CptB